MTGLPRFRVNNAKAAKWEQNRGHWELCQYLTPPHIALRAVHDFCALRQNEPNFIFLTNDASRGAAAGKIAGVEFIDENGGGP
jgi:hypothetical protein